MTSRNVLVLLFFALAILLILIIILNSLPKSNCNEYTLARHHDNEEIEQLFRDIHNDPVCKDITKIGYLDGDPDVTVGGYHLWYIIFSDNPDKHERRKILIISSCF